MWGKNEAVTVGTKPSGSEGGLRSGTTLTEGKFESSVIDTGEVASTTGLVVSRLEGERVAVDTVSGGYVPVLVRLDIVEVMSVTFLEAILSVKFDLTVKNDVLSSVNVETSVSPVTHDNTVVLKELSGGGGLSTSDTSHEFSNSLGHVFHGDSVLKEDNVVDVGSGTTGSISEDELSVNLGAGSRDEVVQGRSSSNSQTSVDSGGADFIGVVGDISNSDLPAR